MTWLLGLFVLVAFIGFCLMLFGAISEFRQYRRDKAARRRHHPRQPP